MVKSYFLAIKGMKIQSVDFDTYTIWIYAQKVTYDNEISSSVRPDAIDYPKISRNEYDER